MMSDERLAFLHATVEYSHERMKQPMGAAEFDMRSQFVEAMAEVDRLRAALHDQEQLRFSISKGQHEMRADLEDETSYLRAEVAAMRPIVERFAAVSDDDYEEQCPFCREMPGYTAIVHTPDCPVTQARAYLAEHPHP